MKFYAGLTSNQPNGYLDRLIKENGKALVFVCPEQRKASLWTKVKDLCKGDGREVSDEVDYRVRVNGIAMTVPSWAEVIETLRKTAAAVSVEMLSDIEQFAGFCQMMDSSAFIPFSSEDLGPDNARREERNYQVIDRLLDVIVANKDLHASTKGLKASPNRVGYTRYLRIGEYQVGLLYNRTAWMDKTSVETPFWFYFNDDEWKQSEFLQKRLRAIPEFERQEIDGKISVALHTPTDVLLDEVANNMMQQIIRFMEFIQR